MTHMIVYAIAATFVSASSGGNNSVQGGLRTQKYETYILDPMLVEKGVPFRTSLSRSLPNWSSLSNNQESQMIAVFNRIKQLETSIEEFHETCRTLPVAVRDQFRRFRFGKDMQTVIDALTDEDLKAKSNEIMARRKFDFQDEIDVASFREFENVVIETRLREIMKNPNFLQEFGWLLGEYHANQKHWGSSRTPSFRRFSFANDEMSADIEAVKSLIAQYKENDEKTLEKLETLEVSLYNPFRFAMMKWLNDAKLEMIRSKQDMALEIRLSNLNTEFEETKTHQGLFNHGLIHDYIQIEYKRLKAKLDKVELEKAALGKDITSEMRLSKLSIDLEKFKSMQYYIDYLQNQFKYTTRLSKAEAEKMELENAALKEAESEWISRFSPAEEADTTVEMSTEDEPETIIASVVERIPMVLMMLLFGGAAYVTLTTDLSGYSI